MENLRKLFIEEIGLSEEFYEEFLSVCKAMNLRKKEYLIEEGNICKFIGIVQNGVLRSFFQKDGEEYISDFYFSNLL